MILHKMGEAVNLVGLLLQEHPLSQPSTVGPDQAAQGSPAPQAVPNSSPAKATHGSPASQAQAAPASRAEPSSPPGEAARESPALPFDPAQTSAPSCKASTSPKAAPLLLEDALEAAVEAAVAKFGASEFSMEEPGWSRSVQQDCLDVTEGKLARWQTPSAAAWRQISTISVRAVHALHWVSQLHTNCKSPTGDLGSVGQTFALVSANLLMIKLKDLLQQLLWGHFSDVSLDFQPILQAGLAPIVRLHRRDDGCKRHLGLVMSCLERMAQDSMQGRVKEPADEAARAEQLYSVFTLLGKLKLNRS